MNNRVFRILAFIMPVLLFLPLALSAGGGSVPQIGGVRLEFILFGLTLIGVALFHNHTMWVALIGLLAVVMLKLFGDSEFNMIQHLVGSAQEEGEWRTLLNLTGLLFGFAILARIFEESGIPEMLPRYLPNDWKGGLVLLLLIMFISSFLDNIAAAIIGGTIAMVVYKGKVHIGFLAAIVAASNAGGAGSVVGDTTTTLMWIDGASPLYITKAFIASVVAFSIFGVFASRQQHKFQPIQANASNGRKIDVVRLLIVLSLLICTIITNYTLDFPAVGVWVAILIGALIRPMPWGELKKAWQGTIFLVSLVTIASMMPVDELPVASWQTALSLGFVSAVFDNIPLTKLCLEQGGYDWGILAYAVGFGGSMIWFGSSAGVALANLFPEAKSVVKYVKNGWHVALAYVVGFFIMLWIGGWEPEFYKENNDKTKVKTEIIQTTQEENNEQ